MMMKMWPATMVLLVLAAVLAGADEHVALSKPLRLERRLTNASTDQLVKMDQMRHARQGLDGGVAQLPVAGKGYNYPDMIGGPYLTRVQLGTPPQEFHVLIDTGSHMPWVDCHTPGVPGLTSQQASFDPRSSSTSSPLACSDSRCQDMVRTTDLALCNNSSGVCEFDLQYGPGSAVYSEEIGHYLSDVLHLEILKGAGQKSSTTIGPVIFGNYYELNLESISVNGQELTIDPSVFRPSRVQKTVVDSGTTFAYLADGAFDPFVDAIAAAVSPSVRPVVRNGDKCFVTSSSVDSLFPTLTLHFVGGAAMTLKPKNYLRSYASQEDQTIYCVAWKRNYGKQLTVLGDIVLMDKIIVHDLENMLFGWTEYDCSRSVNVVSSTRKKHVNSGHVSYRISINTLVAIMLAHVLIVYAISTASCRDSIQGLQRSSISSSSSGSHALE